MKVLVVIDAHLVRTPDGKVWSPTIYNYAFMARYLEVFEQAKIVARIEDRPNHNGFLNLCSGKNVEFFAIPEYRGPKEYIAKYFKIQNIAKSCFADVDCGIFRVPSTIGYKYAKLFAKTKKPYALEVVIDPWDFAAPGNLQSVFRPAIRLIWTKDLKKLCKKANGVSYVTKEALQSRYPAKARLDGKESKQYFESYYSSVELDKEFFEKDRIFDHKKYIDIIHIANNISNYVKGHKELIEAVAELHDKGINAKVTLVGDGPKIAEFEALAKERGIADNIRFIGRLATKQDVKKELLKHDIFVFPSHAEGLPRVVIEAMALSTPCISTNINGMPELIEQKYLVEVGQTTELADKILELWSDKKELKRVSKRNFKEAETYEKSILQKRRNDYYRKLANLAKQS